MTAQPNTIKKTLGHSDFDQLVSQLQNTLHSLQDQVNSRTQDLEIASQIARQVSRELNLDTLLQSAVDLTRDGFNLYHAHIYLLDKEGQDLVLAAGAGEVGRKLVGQSHRIPLSREQSIVARAARTGEGVVINDVRQTPDFMSNPLLPDTRAEMAIPMVVGDKVVGVLDVQSDTTDRFSDEDVRIKGILAEQIAIAVQNAYNFEVEKQQQTQLEQAQHETETLYKLSQAINDATNYDDIIAAVRKYLAHEDAILVTISLFDGEDYTTSNNLTIFAEWSKSRQSFQGYTFPIEQYPVLKFMERDKVSATDDVAGLDEASREVMYQMGLQAFLLAPLVANDKWFGLIGISSGQPHKHTAEQLRLVSAASKQIAAAVTRFRLMQETHDRAAELDTMYKLGADINSATSYDDIIVAVREHLAHEDATLVTISLFDGEDYTTSNNLTIFAEWSKSGQSFQGYTFPIEQNPVLKFMKRDSLSVTDDVAELDETTRETMSQMGLQAFLLAPLVFNERCFGMIAISSAQPHKHTSQQLRLVAAASEQIAAAVTRFRLLDQVQTRVLELETVATVTADVTRNLNLNSLLQEVADLTKDRFGLYHAHIYLLDADGKSLVLASGAGEVGRILTEKGHKIPLDREHSLVARAARTHEAVIVNDVSQNSYFMPNALLPDTKAEMAIPMLLGDEVIGVLDVQANVTNRFTPQDIQIKSILAGQVAAAVKNARAFEQERESAERLREVDRLKSEFLANMSHELRTPLNSIIGYAEVLIDGIDGELSEEAQMDVNDIHASGKHLLAIINDILDLAKIEAGQMMIDHQPVNVNDVVKDVVHTAQILVKEKPVTVEMNTTDALPPVLGDTTRLRQVILNLVSNAVKFTESGSVVVETGCSKDSEIFVKVKDTGMGISPEGLKLIFERFSQVDGSATRRKEGTGLGLTITRELVHMHGGEIYAESKVGTGSTFWFTLPIHVPQAVR